MAPENKEELLNERAQRLLRVLVQNYIRDGQPVGSRTLSRDSGLSLSSATIRNVMADLESLGFVASPHTSMSSREAAEPAGTAAAYPEGLKRFSPTAR